MKKIFLSIVICFSILLTVTTFAHAADFNVDCGDSGCTKSDIDPLFDKTIDGVWYPGRTLTKTINLKNSSSSFKEMSIKPDRTSSVNILEDVMIVSIVANPGGLVVWAGSLTDFYNQSSISMGSFNSGDNQDYNVTVSLENSANNDYQNLESKFDLTLGFWEVDITPTCNETAPASAPTLVSVIGGINSVILTWSAASDPVSYYLVAYGVSPNNNTYGNPNVGGKGTTSYTIGGLSGGTTYCFMVRAGNGCMPGDFSNQICMRPSGGFVAAAVAPGFVQGVLGAATPEATLVPTEAAAGGEIEGVQVKLCRCLWWQILLGEFLAIFLYYFLVIKKQKNKLKKFVLIGLAIPLLTFIIYLWINRICFGGFKLVIFPQTKDFFCR